MSQTDFIQETDALEGLSTQPKEDTPGLKDGVTDPIPAKKKKIDEVCIFYARGHCNKKKLSFIHSFILETIHNLCKATLAQIEPPAPLHDAKMTN